LVLGIRITSYFIGNPKWRDYLHLSAYYVQNISHFFEYFSDERSEKQTFMCNQVMANIDMPPEDKTVPITQFH
jgi:hypothetical protein